MLIAICNNCKKPFFTGDELTQKIIKNVVDSPVFCSDDCEKIYKNKIDANTPTENPKDSHGS